MRLCDPAPALGGMAVALLLAAGGCEQREPPARRPAPAAAAGPSSVAPASLFFVGRWAARPELCTTDPWIITARELRTPAGVVCQLGPARGAGPVDIEATCAVGASPRRSHLHLAYAESARALLIENGPSGDVCLVRCPGAAYRSPEPKPPGASGGLPDDRTPVSEAPFTPQSAQGAADVLQTYFALLESGRFTEAWRLWSDGGRASGLDAAAFAASFAGYDSYHAQVGAPGRIEGAAGSLFVDVPVQIYARRKDGQEVHRAGTVTLRRVNDVPGATAEQRRWRISRLELQPPAP